MPAEAARDTSRWRLLALLVGCSGPIIGGLAWAGCTLWLLLGLHGLAAFGAWRLWRRPGPGGRELGLQAGTLMLCFPVIGSPCTWFIYGRPGRHLTGVADAYARYVSYGQREPLYLRPLDARARLLREVGVMPLRDQLGQGDISGKQSAAHALAQVPGAEGVKVLRSALTHPADDTRLLASLALLRKEEGLVSALNQARAACKVPAAPASAWSSLASVARTYAESGLPAPRAAETYWQECEAAALRALALVGVQALETWLCVAASRAGRNNWPGALEAADAALALDAGCTEATLGRCEALFALGALDALCEAVRPLAAVAELEDMVDYWGASRAS